MSVQDIIKNSFLESFNNTFTLSSLVSMAIALLAALVFGLLIFLIYNKFYRGVVYNRSFAITLIGMTVMTAMVTLAISTNIVISLGMVGALSIVRYRTAVKEPLDLLYLFWAITTGIAAGAQMYTLAIMAGVIMTLVLLVFNRRSKGGRLYIVIVHYKDELTSDLIRKAMASYKYRTKSKTLRGETTEMAMEVSVPNQNMTFVERLRAIDGVEDVTAIQYDGEYHG
ncbi:MAG TPA: DUF4956 domain-containing protein [Firmicutes bacterium]|nr:DUF4956 domain-containing protein [Bacillota bacterium]